MFSHENAYLIFLGRLAQHDINRNDPIWAILPKAAKAEASAVLFHKNASFICLGHLGQHDTSRKKPICASLAKVTKASKIKKTAYPRVKNLKGASLEHWQLYYKHVMILNDDSCVISK